MKILALAAGASFLVVGTLVGVRLLLLAHRTRSLPELLLGAGLSSLTFVTLPLIAVSLGARLGDTTLQTALFATGLVPVIGFAMCLHAFTARVFRPGRLWATAAVVLSGVVASIGTVGTVAGRLSAWEADRVVALQWTALMVAPFLAGMAWTGIESIVYHRRLRRRLALGLADPVVCNRFALWAIGNLGAVVGLSVMLASMFVGWRVVEHPLPILGIAFAGLALSGSWSLAFLPPAAYLRRLRERAPTSPGSAQPRDIVSAKFPE